MISTKKSTDNPEKDGGIRMKSRGTLVSFRVIFSLLIRISDVMFYLMDYGVFPGSMDLVERRTKMSEEDLRKEIDWVQSLIQVVFCSAEPILTLPLGLLRR